MAIACTWFRRAWINNASESSSRSKRKRTRRRNEHWFVEFGLVFSLMFWLLPRNKKGRR